MGFWISLILGGIGGILWVFARLGDRSTPGWKARNLFFMLVTWLGVGAGGTFPGLDEYRFRMAAAFTFWLAAIAIFALPIALVYYAYLRHQQNLAKRAEKVAENERTPEPDNGCTLIDENAIYAAVGAELDTGNVALGLWTKLYARCGGDETKLRVLYIEERASILIAAERERLMQGFSARQK
ncbi:hypothetical protein FQZ97_671450 [compost metagenome]